jgi:histidinol-phosphate aminotransferase
MIDELVSKRVIGLESYKVEPEPQGMILDKNELPWNPDEKVLAAIIESIRTLEFNRYPDNDCTELKTAISRYVGVSTDWISMGNGSDELIYQVLQAFIDPGDVIAVQNPTFSMYKTYGSLCGARVWEYDLGSDFEVELDEFIGCLQKEKPKVTFICNPNNPTGRILEPGDMEKLLERVPGIVVVDEAYFEFSGQTAVKLLSGYGNLIILRTFSKALGLAGLRIGYMLAAPSVIRYIDRVRPPFNVNRFSQIAAAVLLDNLATVEERIEIIKSERKRLTVLFEKLESIQCFPSWSNFILIRSEQAEKIKSSLRESGIYIKSFSNPKLKDCLRITIGSRSDNDKCYEAVKEVLYGEA